MIAIIFNLIADRKMSEAQSVLWIIIGVFAIIIGLFPKMINIIAQKFGVWYPPALTFLIAYVVLLFILLKTTVLTSIQSNQINELFMEVILIKKENENLKKELKLIKKEGESDQDTDIWKL